MDYWIVGLLENEKRRGRIMFSLIHPSTNPSIHFLPLTIGLVEENRCGGADVQ